MCLRRGFGVIVFLMGSGILALTVGLGYSLITGHHSPSAHDFIMIIITLGISIRFLAI